MIWKTTPGCPESIPGDDGTNERILMDTDPYAQRYYDGQDYWEITLD